MPFCLVLFACAFFVKTIRFSEVFFAENLGEGGGEGGGGEEGGLNLTCVAAWPKGP